MKVGTRAPLVPPILIPGVVAALEAELHAMAGGDMPRPQTVAALIRLCQSHEELRRMAGIAAKERPRPDLRNGAGAG